MLPRHSVFQKHLRVLNVANKTFYFEQKLEEQKKNDTGMDHC